MYLTVKINLSIDNVISKLQCECVHRYINYWNTYTGVACWLPRPLDWFCMGGTSSFSSSLLPKGLVLSFLDGFWTSS